MLKEEIIMRGKQLGFPRLSKKSHDNQATMIATIVQEAIEAEREAVEERVVDLFTDMETPYLPDIVKAIRAGSEA